MAPTSRCITARQASKYHLARAAVYPADAAGAPESSAHARALPPSRRYVDMKRWCAASPQAHVRSAPLRTLGPFSGVGFLWEYTMRGSLYELEVQEASGGAVAQVGPGGGVVLQVTRRRDAPLPAPCLQAWLRGAPAAHCTLCRRSTRWMQWSRPGSCRRTSTYRPHRTHAQSRQAGGVGAAGCGAGLKAGRGSCRGTSRAQGSGRPRPAL